MRRLLYLLARTWPGSVLLSWAFARMAFAIPSERLRETDTLIAFEHPRLSHPVHILIVPKGRYRSILELPDNATGFMGDLFRVVKSLVEEFGLEEGAYRLVMNGGSYQEVKHLHFHLFSEGIAQQGDGTLNRTGLSRR